MDKTKILINLSEQNIRGFLKEKYKHNKIIVFQSIDSTNNYAKEISSLNDEDGTIIVANEQTSGRGRMGRNFYSPAESGVYMSIILKPNVTINDISLFTIATAVAVCKVIERFVNVDAKIKWVNDIFINNKKVGGILTETTGGYENLIIGIGLNVSTAVFPDELNKIAASISINELNRNELIGEITNELLSICENINDSNILKEYKERSIVLNQYISYTYHENIAYGKVIDINEHGNLVVINDNNEQIILHSGEVSLKTENIQKNLFN